MWKTKATPETSIVEEEDDSNIEVLKEYNGWYLCATSEQKLEQALEKQAALVVNNFLVLKFIGKMTALCIKDMDIGGAHFKKGMWYSPVDFVRDSLRSNFEAGVRQVTQPNGQWVEMRELNGQSVDENRQYTDELDPEQVAEREHTIMEEAIRYAASAETELPDSIDGQPREDFHWQEVEDEPMIDTDEDSSTL